MAVQEMRRTGGRRFGPTALALQSVPAAVPVPWHGPGVAAPGPRRRTAPVPDRRRRRRAPAACPTGSAAGPYRMGRWARLSMTVVVTAAIVVATFTVMARPATAPTAFVTVEPGDTLSTLVARDLPDWDPARAMAAVASLNGLAGQRVEVGSVLRVPAS